jgi:sugar O-acyltransferase (sialic acid O-acetyltransferase NeuD family)
MKIIIIGAYGTALNIADCITHASVRYGLKDEVLGFAIDNKELGDNIGGYPILCAPADICRLYADYDDVGVIYCLYHPLKMKERTELLAGYKIPYKMFYTFVHPSSYVARSAKLGVGNAVLANCSIHSRVLIGNHNIINSNVTMEHDTAIENSNFIAAGVCIGSMVKIKTSSFIGLNSTVREGTVIGDNSFVGMASNVLKNVEGETVLGNPAKVRQ